MSTKQKLLEKPYIPDKWEDVCCPVCQCNKFRKWERFGDKLQYAYVLCKNCHLVYLNPRPVYNESFIYDAYEFYAEDDKRYRMTDDYYEKQTDAEKNEVNEIGVYDTTRSNLLEVGVATGKFLYRAKPVYAKVTGIEVSKHMARLVEDKIGIKVYVVRFEDFQTNDKYSCIVMSHVLEHFPFPHQWLQKSKELLAPGGIVVICVPNMFSLDRLFKNLIKRCGLFINKWEAWRTPDHLFEPTLKAMKHLFDSENYKIIESYSYSRKRSPTASPFWSFYYRKLFFGTNLRFIVTPVNNKK